MIVHYGYQNGSGDYFIRLDTEKCTACGDCVPSCPAGVFTVSREDPLDPFREVPVAVVRETKRRKIKYTCGPCKPPAERPPLPCLLACRAGAISHSW